LKIIFSSRFMDLLESAPPAVRRAFYKQLAFLQQDPRHPSLRTKKFDEASGVWQARVNGDWRFYFTIENGAYHLHKITAHAK
jgi:mRNA interferase RelE/StbE